MAPVLVSLVLVCWVAALLPVAAAAPPRRMVAASASGAGPPRRGVCGALADGDEGRCRTRPTGCRALPAGTGADVGSGSGVGASECPLAWVSGFGSGCGLGGAAVVRSEAGAIAIRSPVAMACEIVVTGGLFWRRDGVGSLARLTPTPSEDARDPRRCGGERIRGESFDRVTAAWW